MQLTLAEYCWDHLLDKDRYRTNILAALNRGDALNGCNLKKVVLKDSHVDKASLAKADLSQVDASGSHIFNSTLEGADLIGANLSNCDLTHCSLKDADLTKANLSGSRLWNSDLMGANLTECDLSHADLWNATLFNAKLWRTNFEGAKSVTQSTFSHNALLGNSKIDEMGLLSAEESYRDLKRYFMTNGMYNDASWASFKEKTIERLVFKKNRSLKYFPSLIMNVLCGYGEKPYRIVLSAMAAIILFAIAYFSIGAIENSAAPTYVMKWTDYVYYSTITFTTVGYGDFIPKGHALFRFLAACEAFAGVFLTGLFIFTLARKYSAR